MGDEWFVLNNCMNARFVMIVEVYVKLCAGYADGRHCKHHELSARWTGLRHLLSPCLDHCNQIFLYTAMQNRISASSGSFSNHLSPENHEMYNSLVWYAGTQ